MSQRWMKPSAPGALAVEPGRARDAAGRGAGFSAAVTRNAQLARMPSSMRCLNCFGLVTAAVSDSPFSRCFQVPALLVTLRINSGERCETAADGRKSQRGFRIRNRFGHDAPGAVRELVQ